MSVLCTESLDVTVGGKHLIRILVWRFVCGLLWCVLGQNGVGKTSLLYVLSGLLMASSGKVFIRGRPIDGWPVDELASVRGLMPQQQADAFSHSVLDTVLIGRTPYRLSGVWDSAEEREAALAALERIGMQDRSNSDVLRLSGGERQRVALGALLMQHPELMLLDEPTAHQDVAHQLMMMGLIRELTAQHAIVMTCHDINLAVRYATHVLVLAHDRKRQSEAQTKKTPQEQEQANSSTKEEAQNGSARSV